MRSAIDRQALWDGVCDGTIECIATDHAPHTAEEKARGLLKSAMGIVGLETAFAVSRTALGGKIAPERLLAQYLSVLAFAELVLLVAWASRKTSVALLVAFVVGIPRLALSLLLIPVALVPVPSTGWSVDAEPDIRPLPELDLSRIDRMNPDVDVETAKNAGVDLIGVEWGFRPREVLLAHGAKVTVKRTDELLRLILGE